jgi:RecB family endonuclease NucS
MPEVELNEPAEVELDEPAEVELNEPAEVGDPRAPADATDEKDEPPIVATGVRAPSFGSPDPDALRTLLAEQPELLEPGLSVYTSDKGTPQGAGYTSGVGEIDLLARDGQGALVVVMIGGGEAGAELVSAVLQRIGWVSKHLSGKSQRVRGIVLLDEVREEIGYTAAAVADKVSFKTWRMALTFNEVEF